MSELTIDLRTEGAGDSKGGGRPETLTKFSISHMIYHSKYNEVLFIFSSVRQSPKILHVTFQISSLSRKHLESTRKHQWFSFVARILDIVFN